MHRAMLFVAVGGFVMLAACAREEPAVPAPPQPGTPEWKIQNALSAAPEAVTSGASVHDWPASDSGAIVELRAGTNGWDCVPDDPRTPGVDPGCADEEMSRYWDAWMRRTPPRLGGMAVGYALQGTQVASLTDPFKTAPDSGQAWVDVAPAVLIALPNPRAYAGFPTAPAAAVPWVLWARTPFALIVVPTARQAQPQRADSAR